MRLRQGDHAAQQDQGPRLELRQGRPARGEDFDTTPGRLILGNSSPNHVKIPFDVINKLMTKRKSPT